MRKQITHFSVHQTSKVIASLYFLMTLIIAIPGAVLGFLFYKEQAFFLYLIYPFVFAIITYISTVIWVWLYNRVAGSFGGIEVDLEED